jgi:hypothetical protein
VLNILRRVPASSAKGRQRGAIGHARGDIHGFIRSEAGLIAKRSSGTRLNARGRFGLTPFTKPSPQLVSSATVAGEHPSYGFSLATFPPSGRYQGQERHWPWGVRDVLRAYRRRRLRVWWARKWLTRKGWEYRVRPTSPLLRRFCAGRLGEKRGSGNACRATFEVVDVPGDGSNAQGEISTRRLAPAVQPELGGCRCGK